MKVSMGSIGRLWPRRYRAMTDPGERMFAQLRRRLTWWYCSILGGLLVLFGVLLYTNVHGMLFDPVSTATSQEADTLAFQWQHPLNIPPSNAPSPNFPTPGVYEHAGHQVLVACFDQNGNLIQNNPGGDFTPPPAFLDNTLVLSALQHKQVSDTLNTASNYGDVYRYAEVVPNPSGPGILGVVQVGESVNVQEAVLSQILSLLLILGIPTLLIAAAGGLYLSYLSLAPARLAFTHQQAFIADASHELRTPLTLLRTDAEVLLRGRDRMDPDDSMLLEDIVTEAGHMAAITDNLLTLARLDAGSVHMEREIVDLGTVATTVGHRIRAFANEKQITVDIEPEGPTLVIGDRILLEQAILILADNAIRYNRPGGSVRIHTSLKQDQACVEISDTGVGMTSEHLAHVGERFYRVDKARSREAGGTGLGISIARSIAAAHQGRLTFTSVPHQGTTALLTFPTIHPIGQP
jgi:signal transduction histidine kinase